MAFLKRFVRAFPALLVSPIVMAIAAVALAITDSLWWLFGRRAARERPLANSRGSEGELAGGSACPTAASVVIPNWNGKDLLEKYLPSVVEALRPNPENEII